MPVFAVPSGTFQFRSLVVAIFIVLQGLFTYLPPIIFDVNRGHILVITSSTVQ